MERTDGNYCLKKGRNVLIMKYASLGRIVLSKSVIIGPVNCTHAFNCWTVTVAACKHAAQQLVTVQQDLTSCPWACYWPETVISLSLPATLQRCRETEFAFLLHLTQSQSSICLCSAEIMSSVTHLFRPSKMWRPGLSSVLFVKGGSPVLCEVKRRFLGGGGRKDMEL